MLRIALAFLAALVLAAPHAEAQRRIDPAPRRPALAAEADSNDAAAYYSRGVSLLPRHAEEAAAAFYWAIEIDPRSAAALYGRHASLLMAEGQRILDYYGLTDRPRHPADMMHVDSLYYRALMLDPFVQRRFEREVMRVLIASWLVGGDTRQVNEQAALNYQANLVMQRLAPVFRARIHAADGRVDDAIVEYDAALRENRRRQESRRWIHHERGRVFALGGRDSLAHAELTAAITAEERRQQRELVRVYSNKALLEHSRGVLFERSGDAMEAREAYARALTEDLSYHPAHARLATLALAGGDTATALLEMALAAETAPNDAATRYAYGSLLVQTESWEAAAAELAAATELAPLFADAWLLLGAARHRRGDLPGALEAYRGFVERARRADPRREQVAAGLAQMEGS